MPSFLPKVKEAKKKADANLVLVVTKLTFNFTYPLLTQKRTIETEVNMFTLKPTESIIGKSQVEMIREPFAIEYQLKAQPKKPTKAQKLSKDPKAQLDLSKWADCSHILK